jgi:hypothetical protein
MKTRSGFVSNSSSMSFVIFGTSTDIWDITDPVKENVWAIGGPAGEGWDVFQINLEMLMDLRNSENHCHLNLIKAYKTLYIDGPGDCATVDNDLPRRFEVFSVEKSHHSINGKLDVFRERYMKTRLEKK